jgi:chromosomal replication initiator protein
VNITIAAVQRCVAKQYRIPFDVMRERDAMGTRIRDHSHPRQVAMALSRRLTKHGFPRIGYYFGGRDHSTVHHACAAVAKRRKSDPELRNVMRRMRLGLLVGGPA